MKYGEITKWQRKAFREYFNGQVTYQYVMEYLEIDYDKFQEIKEVILRHDSEKFSATFA